LLCHVNGRTMQLELSPAYDLVPTGSGALEHQFMVSEDSREPSLALAMSGAETFNLSPPDAAAEVTKIIVVVNGWQAHFSSIGVTERDITEVAALVDAPELIGQRLAFRADEYLCGKTRRKTGLGARAFR
jgi:serine/threonine-protein kinase HipA